MIYNITTILSNSDIQYIARSAEDALRKLDDSRLIHDSAMSEVIKTNLKNLKENSSYAVELDGGAELLIGCFDEVSLAA